MAEQAPKSPERKAAEIRYRNRAFGPGPEGRQPRPALPKYSGVYYGGSKPGMIPNVKPQRGATNA